MATPQSTFAIRYIWLALFIFGSPATSAESPADEPYKKLALLDPIVGSWVYDTDKQDGFSVHQECKWILNKQFLEIDTQVLRAGHPPTSWRTLVTYDQTSNCYRQWKFSDNGVVSTAKGTWDEKSSALILTGRTPNGNDSESSVEIIDDTTIKIAEREFLDEKHTRMAVVHFILSRVPLEEDH